MDHRCRPGPTERRWTHVVLAVASAVLATLSGVRAAHAFGEDATSVDPAVSSHHFYLTRALASCAGIPSTADPDLAASPAEAELIAIYDQMTDTRTHGAFSLCDAPAFVPPTATDVGCPAGTTLAWPSYRGDDLDTCFASRTGLYSTVFHFPTAENLASLRAWGLGTTPTLRGEASYAFGAGGDVFTASCYQQRAETIDTGAVRAGTPEAFGIYLHAVADELSHRVCCDNWGDTANPPWCMHTRVDMPAGCIGSMHRLEYGCPDDAPPPMAPMLDATPFVDHTVDAAEAVFAELLAYASARGHTPVLSSFDDRGGWLRRQVERFGSRTAIGSSAARIALTHAIHTSCRSMPPASCPADLALPDELSCSYPLTRVCEEGESDAGTSPAGPDASLVDASLVDAYPMEASVPLGADADTPSPRSGGGCSIARSFGRRAGSRTGPTGLGALALGALVLGALALRTLAVRRRGAPRTTKQEK